MATGFRNFFITLFCVLVLHIAHPAHAAGEIAKAEAWLNSITTLEARFVQTSSDGSKATGKLFWRRPYRSRFEFEGDTPLILITTRNWIHVDETERRQLSSYPVSETPLSALLAEEVRLTGDDFTTTVESGRDETGHDIFRITLTQIGGARAGKLGLDFTQEPVALLRWHLTDANGVITVVEISDIVTGNPLAARLFAPNRYLNENNR